ncbi:Ank protein [Pseudocowpox virus]
MSENGGGGAKRPYGEVTQGPSKIDTSSCGGSGNSGWGAFWGGTGVGGGKRSKGSFWGGGGSSYGGVNSGVNGGINGGVNGGQGKL